MAVGDKMLMNLNYGLEVDNFYLTTININFQSDNANHLSAGQSRVLPGYGLSLFKSIL
jgi:hypothetical protein